MTANTEKIDRGTRLVVAAFLIIAAFEAGAAGSVIPFWPVLIVAAVLTLTAVVGNDPFWLCRSDSRRQLPDSEFPRHRCQTGCRFGRLRHLGFVPAERA